MKGSFFKGQLSFLSKMKTRDKLILIGGLAVMIMLSVSLLYSPSAKPASTSSTLTADEYRAYLEGRLVDSLSNVQGVGNVKVLITLQGGMPGEVVYEMNETSNTSVDPSGRQTESKSVSQSTVYSKDGSQTQPYVSYGAYPAISGVVVIAEGGDDSNVKYFITSAVKTALDVPAHKIVVLPMKKK